MYKQIIIGGVLASSLMFAGYTAADNTTKTAQREVSFYVKEMTCQLCVYLVNKTLRAVDGVITTKADMNAHTVRVIADTHVTDEQLINAVKELHYTAEPIE